MRLFHYVLMVIVTSATVATFGQSDADFLWSTQFQEADLPGATGTIAAMDNTPDGGLFVSGSLPNLAGIYVGRLASNGDPLWIHDFNADNQSSSTSSLRSLSDGGFVIGGRWTCEPFVSIGRLARFDGEGEIIWEECYPGTTSIQSVEITPDGGFILLANNTDFWERPLVIKTDQFGQVEWSEQYGEDGTTDITATAVEVTSDGGYIFTSIYTPYQQQGDFFVVKIDSVGNLEWQNTYGGSNGEDGGGIFQTDDGGYMIIGSTFSNDGDVWIDPSGTGILVLKLDAVGTVVNSLCYDGPSGQNYGNSCRATDGGFLVSCSTSENGGDVTGFHGGNRDVWVLRLDHDGLLVWQRCFGGSDSDTPRDIAQRSDGSVAILSRTNSSDGDVTGIGTQWVTAFNMIGQGIGINESSLDASLAIYPNPSTADFMVELELPRSAKLGLTIFNITGQSALILPIRDGVSGVNRFTISGEDLPNGVYYLKMDIGQNIVTRRIVKM